MSITVTMPQLGESVVEGTIAKWLVAEGDAVQEDQALVEITTDKIDTEIPSPAAGVIGRIRVAEGETVKIGTVLCEIEPAGAGAEAPARPGGPPRREKVVAPAAGVEGALRVESPPSVTLAKPAGRERPAEPPPPAAAPGRPRSRAAGAAVGEAPSAGMQAIAEPEAIRPAPSPPAVAVARSARERPGVPLDEARTEAARARRRRARANEEAVADGKGAVALAEPRITPVVRKMAAEYDVDLSQIRGTGVGGRITREDMLQHLNLASMADTHLVEAREYGEVLGIEAPRPEPGPRTPRPAAASLKEAAASRRGAAPAAAAGAAPVRGGLELREYVPPEVQPLEGDRVEPFSRRRKIIAEHMVYSKAVSPHVYTMAEIDLSRVVALREARKRPFREAEGVSLTYLHFVIAATARALREFPRMNAVVGRAELILRRDVNIGVAVETEQGLVVPVVRNADRLSLRGIAREVEEQAVKARERKLRVEDLQGGTFTVSNPGREGNLVGFAIINQPQLGILRMGEIRKRPVVVEMDGADAIVIRPIMLMSLTYDHRVIDGVTGNSFLYAVKGHLERGEFEI